MSAFTDEAAAILPTMEPEEVVAYTLTLLRFVEQTIDLWTAQNDSDDELYSEFFHEVGYLIEEGPA